MAEFLKYWLPSTYAERYSAGQPLRYVASSQLQRAQAGDRIWICTVDDECLRLIGYVDINVLGDRMLARSLLRDLDLWEADLYAIARPDAWQSARYIDISCLAADLAFEGDRDKLPSNFTGQHLQSMRKLTPASAGMLRAIWQSWEPPC
jgi:hypothetical protein